MRGAIVTGTLTGEEAAPLGIMHTTPMLYSSTEDRVLETTMQMSQSREIRVFLSSTFKDMEEERDYLLTQIFPALRRICSERQVAFTEIDLRWGVTEEASQNGRTVEICLEEIDRCRIYPPFFIGFLGERYGWVPQPADLDQFWKTRPDSPYAQVIRSALAQGISVTELEMRYGFLTNPDAATHARIFLRAPELTDKHYAQSGQPERSDFYDSGDGKLNTLKTDLRTAGSVQLDGYASIEAFGEAVFAFIKQGLDQLFPTGQQLSSAEQRTHSHAIFAASRRKSYVPLGEMRQHVLNALDTLNTKRINVVGASGLGKSALAADLELWLPQQRDTWLFAHYTGADGDRSLEGWRDRLLDTLEETGKVMTPVPTATKARWDMLPTALLEAQQGLGKPMVLLLDAIDQLSQPNALARLGQLNLPAGVVLITTSTPEVSTPNWQVFTLPPFGETQRREAAVHFLQEYRKELPPALTDKIAADSACAVPLFLRLVLEELRLHAKHETLAHLSDTLLATKDAGSLFQQVLQAMDADFAASGHTNLASHAARLIAASWRGLQHTDLARLLAGAGDPVDPDDHKPRLPDYLLSPLLSRLEPFCLRDDGRLYIMHAILLKPLLASTMLPATRKELIAYFNTDSGPAIAQRIYQLWRLEDLDTLPRELGNLSTLQTLWKTAPRLLRDVFGTLGAGHASLSPAMGAWLVRVKAAIKSTKTPPADLNNIGMWLIDNYYLSAGEAFILATLESLRNRTLLGAALDLFRYRTTHQPGMGAALNNLANFYYAQGQFQKAEPLFLEALDIYRSVLPPGEPEIALRVDNLASLYHAQGRLQEAEPLYLEALNIRRQKLQPEDPDLATSLNNLASLYSAQKRFQDAETLHLEALNIYRQALPPEHPDIANSLNNLAHLYHKQGQLQEAAPLYLEALNIVRQALPLGHPDIAISLNNLAFLYQEQGLFQAAEPLFLEALNIQREALPIGHQSLLSSLFNLAIIYHAQTRFQEAEALYTEALDSRRQTLPAGHPDLANNLEVIASLYDEQGRLDESEPLYLEALNIRRKALPPLHPDIAASLNNLAFIYHAMDRLQDAEPMYKEVLDIRRQALPEGHEDTLSSLQNLAHLYQEQGRHQEAEQLLTEVKSFNSGS